MRMITKMDIDLKIGDPFLKLKPIGIPYFVWCHFIAYVRANKIQYSDSNLQNAGWWYLRGWRNDIDDTWRHGD